MDSRRSSKFEVLALSEFRVERRSSKLLRGLTYVELLMAIGILGLITLLVATVYIAHFKLFSNEVTIIDAASQNKLALDEMVRQIRQGQAVAANCCSGENSGPDSLVLQLWPLNAQGDPTKPSPSPTLTYDYIIYKKDPTNTKLLKKAVPAAGSSRAAEQKIVTVSISALEFKYYDASGAEVPPANAYEVAINLTTSATYGGKTQTTTQNAKALLRNK